MAPACAGVTVALASRSNPAVNAPTAETVASLADVLSTELRMSVKRPSIVWDCNSRMPVRRSNTAARSDERPDWNPIPPAASAAKTLMVRIISSSLDWMPTRESRRRRGRCCGFGADMALEGSPIRTAGARANRVLVPLLCSPPAPAVHRCRPPNAPDGRSTSRRETHTARRRY